MTPESGPGPSSVLIIGSGLIGASIGLGLRRRGTRVWLQDDDPTAVEVARSRGAGEPGPPDEAPDLVVVAVPPTSAPTVVMDALRTYVTSTVSDVASTKAHLQAEIESSGSDITRFVPGHPLAGREISGPGAARADLFADRVWALTPSPRTDPARTAAVAAMATNLGAVVVQTSPEAHDRAVALTSHTPQVVSSLVAAGLAPLDESDVRLSGQGLRDVTRLASSDPALWTEILSSNAGPVADALDGLLVRLAAVRDGLRDGRPDDVRAALAAGVAGASHVPGKHGSQPVPYAVVPVVIADRPGELGRLFAAVGATGVNLEDVRIEHAQGRPTGIVELEVRPDRAQTLAEGLREAGYEVRD
ncbi:MAG TPA: prephenate dehydrogenase [Candidatus Nanopelagicales bacterium]|nr:prephenate dehydrogenase [Candidatus Nanopelagicales bacterium]